MGRKAIRLYERMKQTQAGWHSHDFHTLYLGFGFKMTHGRNHDVFVHPKYPQLRDTIPRHGELARAYAKDAVKNIETLLKLDPKAGGTSEMDESDE